MKNWLQKTPAPSKEVATRTTDMAKRPKPQLPALADVNMAELTKGLPPATIVYGAASGSFFALAFYFMATGHWLNGGLTLLPACCFLGFAVHLLRHGQ